MQYILNLLYGYYPCTGGNIYLCTLLFLLCESLFSGYVCLSHRISCSQHYWVLLLVLWRDSLYFSVARCLHPTKLMLLGDVRCLGRLGQCSSTPFAISLVWHFVVIAEVIWTLHVFLDKRSGQALRLREGLRLRDGWEQWMVWGQANVWGT